MHIYISISIYIYFYIYIHIYINISIPISIMYFVFTKDMLDEKGQARDIRVHVTFFKMPLNST